MNARPYKFSPAMKNEIEQQVQEMLSKGLIQYTRTHSNIDTPNALTRKRIKHGDSVLIIDTSMPLQEVQIPYSSN
jgi:hypothetical protein